MDVLLGYFLSGCAYLALGMFLSSITETPVLAAVITFGACFLCYMASSLSSFISGTTFATYVALIAVAALVCLLIYSMTKSSVIAGLVFLLAVEVLTVCYFVGSSWMAGGIQRIIGAFDFM